MYLQPVLLNVFKNRNSLILNTVFFNDHEEYTSGCYLKINRFNTNMGKYNKIITF